MRKKDKRTMLEKEIERILEKMSLIENQTSVEYQRLATELDKLVQIDVKHKGATKVDRKKVDPNTLLIIGGEFVMTFVIMTYEKTHVLATKALSHIPRPRL